MSKKYMGPEHQPNALHATPTKRERNMAAIGISIVGLIGVIFPWLVVDFLDYGPVAFLALLGSLVKTLAIFAVLFGVAFGLTRIPKTWIGLQHLRLIAAVLAFGLGAIVGWMAFHGLSAAVLEALS